MSTLAFGDYIKQLRRAAKMGLREAATEIGITPGHLSKIENGFAAPPKGATIHAIARTYGVPVTDLISKSSASQAIETATADERLAPFVTAFYRLAAGRSRSEQLKMLHDAVEGLDLSPEDKAWWTRQMDALLPQQDRGLHRLGGYASNDLYDLQAIPRRLSAKGIERIAIRRLKSFYEGDLTRYRPPTPIDKIIEYSGDKIELSVFGYELGGRLKDGSPAVLGRCRWRDSSTREVGVHQALFDSEDLTARRRGNFTLAHEFFHAIEHLPQMPSRLGATPLFRSVEFVSTSIRTERKKVLLDTNERWREWQANTFAAALLMPGFAVCAYFEEMFDVDAMVSCENELEEFANEISRYSGTIEGFGKTSLSDLFDVNPTAMSIRLRTLGLIKVQ